MPGKYDLERDRGPETRAILEFCFPDYEVRLTESRQDMEGKADWLVSGKGVVLLVGARYLNDRRYTGKFMSLRERRDPAGISEVALWLERAARPRPTGPLYACYLTVWCGGKDGPILDWAMVDMGDWATAEHVEVGSLSAAEHYRGATGLIPWVAKVSDRGVAHRYYPINRLIIPLGMRGSTCLLEGCKRCASDSRVHVHGWARTDAGWCCIQDYFAVGYRPDTGCGARWTLEAGIFYESVRQVAGRRGVDAVLREGG